MLMVYWVHPDQLFHGGNQHSEASHNVPSQKQTTSLQWTKLHAGPLFRGSIVVYLMWWWNRGSIGLGVQILGEGGGFLVGSIIFGDRSEMLRTSLLIHLAKLQLVGTPAAVVSSRILLCVHFKQLLVVCSDNNLVTRCQAVVRLTLLISAQLAVVFLCPKCTLQQALYNGARGGPLPHHYIATTNIFQL